ncbi:unnamed protein product, partial [Closterium sp. NIES-53]
RSAEIRLCTLSFVLGTFKPIVTITIRLGVAGASGAAGAGGAAEAAGAGGAGAAGAGGAGAAGTALPIPFFYPQLQSSLPPPDSPQLLPGSPLPARAPYTEVTGSLIECHEPETRVHACRVARPRPPAVPGTHGMALLHWACGSCLEDGVQWSTRSSSEAEIYAGAMVAQELR